MSYTIFEIDGKFYPVEYREDSYQVRSIGSDSPKEGGCWWARATDDGIKYVAAGRKTRKAAQAAIYRQRKKDNSRF